MPLIYKTRGGSSPQGKQKVYFSCYPKDFDRYFDWISEEILARQNCAVWYREDLSSPLTDQDWADIREMQLFVVPVTTGLLDIPNHAMDEELPFALEHHIPILPLMQESGLEERFGERFGDLQFLDRNAQDPSAIPYEKKLDKYLSSVLVGDELAEQVRAAFDAYIFLSYRKKDRKYAQELMRLIHENEFCRDIAIWYDEYLTPGEDFNAAIRDALEKSDLFALVVTPNLVNELNYVMEHEYPAAKHAGKPLLPAQLVDTDPGELKGKYAGIPDCVDAKDREKFSIALLEQVKKLAIEPNDSDPRHSFFIGLAYLSGIDMEVDTARAVRLITDAAEAELPEAMEKLISMYRTGLGVERDYYTAARWREKLVKALEAAYAEAPTGENGKALFDAIWDLGNDWYALGKLSPAREAYRSMEELCKRAVQTESEAWNVRRSLSVSYNKLGEVSQAEGDLAEAKAYYLKDLDICLKIAEESDTLGARRDLSVSYDRLGNISRAEGDLAEAKAYYQNSLALRLKNAEESDTQEARCSLSVSYSKLGDISEAEGNPAEAKAYYLKGLDIDLKNAEESDTLEARRDLSFSYQRLGEVSQAEGDLAEAKAYYLKGLDIDLKNAEESGTLGARRDLSISYDRLGNVSRAEGDLAEAKAYYQNSLALRLKNAEESDTLEARRDLSVSYNKVGDVSRSEGRSAEARASYLKALDIELKNAEESDTLEARRDLSFSYQRLGDVSRAEGDLAEAKAYYLKALDIDLKNAEESDTLEARRDLSCSYDKLGEVSQAEGDLAEAKVYYLRGLELTCRWADEYKTTGDRDNMALFHYNLGTLDSRNPDKAHLEQAAEIWGELAEQCPTATRYAKNRDVVKKMLKKINGQGGGKRKWFWRKRAD